jgi:hypothetical protein
MAFFGNYGKIMAAAFFCSFFQRVLLVVIAKMEINALFEYNVDIFVGGGHNGRGGRGPALRVVVLLVNIEVCGMDARRGHQVSITACAHRQLKMRSNDHISSKNMELVFSSYLWPRGQRGCCRRRRRRRRRRRSLLVFAVLFLGTGLLAVIA